MPLKTSKWDASEYLKDDDAIAAYLEAAFEDGDLRVITQALGNVARARGMTQIARDAGVTREALYRALSDKGDPRLSTLLGVMKAIGVSLSAQAA
jgi:probable addiction module antidote protein